MKSRPLSTTRGWALSAAAWRLATSRRKWSKQCSGSPLVSSAMWTRGGTQPGLSCDSSYSCNTEPGPVFEEPSLARRPPNDRLGRLLSFSPINHLFYAGVIEYCGIVNTCSRLRGLQALACDLVRALSAQAFVVSTACKTTSSRRRVSKICHLHVQVLLVQTAVQRITIHKVLGTENQRNSAPSTSRRQ